MSISLCSYVIYDEDYRVDDLICPPWESNKFECDPKRLQKEKDEEVLMTKQLISKGILKVRENITIKPTEKQTKINCTPAIVTRLKGIDLYQSCFCGSGQLLKDCCIKIALSKSNKR